MWYASNFFSICYYFMFDNLFYSSAHIVVTLSKEHFFLIESTFAYIFLNIIMLMLSDIVFYLAVALLVSSHLVVFSLTVWCCYFKCCVIATILETGSSACVCVCAAASAWIIIGETLGGKLNVHFNHS